MNRRIFGVTHEQGRLGDLADGAYRTTAYGGLQNYGEKWAYGYLVPIRVMFPDDPVPDQDLFSIRTVDGNRRFTRDVHVTLRAEAEKWVQVAKIGYVWNLRTNKPERMGVS